MPKIDFNVKITKNTKTWDMVVKNLAKSNSYSSQIGFWGNSYPDGTPVAQVAAWNEEGHMAGRSFVPPRPFIRVMTFDKHLKHDVIDRYVFYINRVALGLITWKQLHEQMGREIRDKMKQAIIEFDSPRNSPYTIALKGFDDPLIETRLMLNSVKSRVVRQTLRVVRKI